MALACGSASGSGSAESERETFSVPSVSRSISRRPSPSTSEVAVASSRFPLSAEGEILVNGSSSSASSPVARSRRAREVPWVPWVTSRLCSFSTLYQLCPSDHSGPANSSSRVHSARCSPVSSVCEYRFHQPLRSETKTSSPSVSHSGCSTDSVVEPASTDSVATRPSTRSPTWSSVPSHGICGCSQEIQLSLVPSGLSRGLATKREAGLTSRSLPASAAADPSSGMATM